MQQQGIKLLSNIQPNDVNQNFHTSKIYQMKDPSVEPNVVPDYVPTIIQTIVPKMELNTSYILSI